MVIGMFSNIRGYFDQVYYFLSQHTCLLSFQVLECNQLPLITNSAFGTWAITNTTQKVQSNSDHMST